MRKSHHVAVAVAVCSVALCSPAGAQDTLWNAAGLFARRAAGRRGLVLRRSDVPGATKRFGAGGRTVEGEPMELLLWASGRRDHARVTVS